MVQVDSVTVYQGVLQLGGVTWVTCSDLHRYHWRSIVNSTNELKS
jgi:hypothetical protein